MLPHSGREFADRIKHRNKEPHELARQLGIDDDATGFAAESTNPDLERFLGYRRVKRSIIEARIAGNRDAGDIIMPSVTI